MYAAAGWWWVREADFEAVGVHAGQRTFDVQPTETAPFSMTGTSLTAAPWQALLVAQSQSAAAKVARCAIVVASARRPWPARGEILRWLARTYLLRLLDGTSKDSFDLA
jgi:hypothetical protein